MRINVYSQELTSVVEHVQQPSKDNSEIYHAARLILHSADTLHEDDQSGITFWLPKSQQRREDIALAFEEIARIFRETS